MSRRQRADPWWRPPETLPRRAPEAPELRRFLCRLYPTTGPWIYALWEQSREAQQESARRRTAEHVTKVDLYRTLQQQFADAAQRIQHAAESAQEKEK